MKHQASEDLDAGEQLGHELAGFREPLAEEAVRVDLDQLALAVPMRKADRQLLRQCLAKARLACACM